MGLVREIISWAISELPTISTVFNDSCKSENPN